MFQQGLQEACHWVGERVLGLRLEQDHWAEWRVGLRLEQDHWVEGHAWVCRLDGQEQIHRLVDFEQEVQLVTQSSQARLVTQSPQVLVRLWVRRWALRLAPQQELGQPQVRSVRELVPP